MRIAWSGWVASLDRGAVVPDGGEFMGAGPESSHLLFRSGVSICALAGALGCGGGVDTTAPREPAGPAIQVVEVIDIGAAIPGSWGNSANAVNDSGTVVGYPGFRWNRNEPVVEVPAVGLDINDDGWIVGQCGGGASRLIGCAFAPDMAEEVQYYPAEAATRVNANGDVLGIGVMCWPCATWVGLWLGGTTPPYPLPVDLTAAGLEEAFGLNDEPVVVGRVGGHAAVWQGGNVIKLPTPAGFGSAVATAVNNAGTVVGFGQKGLDFYPLVWPAGEPFQGRAAIVINLRGAKATAVNQSGHVVGSGHQAWVWVQNSVTILPGVSGTPSALGNDINDRDEIVGLSQVPGQPGHATLWRIRVE